MYRVGDCILGLMWSYYCCFICKLLGSLVYHESTVKELYLEHWVRLAENAIEYVTSFQFLSISLFIKMVIRCSGWDICRLVRAHIETVMLEYEEMRKKRREKSKAAKKKVQSVLKPVG